MNVPEQEVRAVFGDAALASLDLLGHSVPAATAGVWRVVAGDDSAILKVIRHDAGGSERWPSSELESDPYYWRREPLAYGSGLLDEIAPLRAPRCRLCVDRPDGSVALWLDDAGAHPAWSIERLAAIARELGLMQGRLAARPPAWPWLSRGWLRAYLELRSEWIEPYREGPFAEEVQRIWARRDEILAAADAAPQTLCHFDFYPANLFGEDTTVVIDWAYCGLGALGLDAGNLVPDAIFDGFVALEQAEELSEAVWDAYLGGVSDSGLSFDRRELRHVFLAATALKYAWIPGTAADRGLGDALGARWLEAFPLLVGWADESSLATLAAVSEPLTGAISVDHVSRRFRVYPQPVRTLKEMLVARGRVKGRDVEALTDVSFAVEPGEAVGLVGRNGSGKTTLLKVVAGIIKPSDGRVAVGGRIGSLLELGAGFHPEFTGRENVYLNGSILGLKREQIRRHMAEIESFSELERFMELPVRTYSSGMVMRLGFAVAAHLEVDVLLLDEVFAVGDEEFQRKCFGKIHEFKQRGGTIVFVSHDAAAVERLCTRAVLLRQGRLEFDGPVRDAITRYHAMLADERDPEERGAGLSEYGSGELRIAEARLLGADGEERNQFSPGETLTVALQVVAARPVPAPRLSYELHDAAGLQLGGGVQDTAELGWSETRTEHALRLAIDSLPLADGRFRFRFELSDAAGGHLYHWLDDAARFVVYPGAGDTGLVHLDARWSIVGEQAAASMVEP